MTEQNITLDDLKQEISMGDNREKQKRFQERKRKKRGELGQREEKRLKAVDYFEKKQAEDKKIINGIMRRTRNLDGAEEIFDEFAPDAAIDKILEMKLADKSADRQNAQDTVLDRALGRAVDRSMSLNVDLHGKASPELDHEIRQLLHKCGIVKIDAADMNALLESDDGPINTDSKAEKEIDSILKEKKSGAGDNKAGEVQSEPGIPTGLHEVNSIDAPSFSRQPVPPGNDQDIRSGFEED